MTENSRPDWLPRESDSDSDSEDEVQESKEEKVDCTRELNETFDQHKLHYIIVNKDKFKDKMRCFDDDYDPFVLPAKFLKKSSEGKIKVEYKQTAGVGRFYAVGSLSMQSMPREIRHTISDEFYTDIDMVNAHPVILSHLCKARKITTKYLDRYTTNRDKLLTELKEDRETSKIAILSLMNGGSKGYDNLTHHPRWLKCLRKEIETIHDAFSYDKEYSHHKAKREALGTVWNHKASYMNTLLCDYENKILQCMWKFFGSPIDCVLCFDGLMLRKGAYDIEACTHYVVDQLGIKIDLKTKPMDEGFIIDEVPEYIEPGRNHFDFREAYDYADFRKEFNGAKFASYEDMVSKLHGKYQKVIAHITSGEGLFIKKVEEQHDTVRSLGHSGFNMYYQADNKKTKISFHDFITAGDYSFSEIKCELTPCGKKNFNIWSGYQAERGDYHEDIEIIKSFILDTWAGGNQEYYNYIISWIKGLFSETINKKALAMISPQGCGKGTLIEFLEYLLRATNIYNTVGISSITQKHNTAIQSKRLIVINEMSATKDEFKSNFDKIKSYITDPKISIEPKGVNPYQINNIGNYILFTNHRDAIIVEEHDRRYAIFEMSSIHMNDHEYFGNIRKCFNQPVANAFYSYLMDFNSVPLGVIPDTELRREMINVSKPTPLKYLNAVFEEDIFDGETEVNASLFYQRYVEWCQENGERSYSSTKFGTCLRDKIEKKRNKKSIVYVLVY